MSCAPFPPKCCHQTASSPTPGISTTCAGAHATIGPRRSLNEHMRNRSLVRTFGLISASALLALRLRGLQEQLRQRRQHCRHQQRHRSCRRRRRSRRRQPRARFQLRPPPTPRSSAQTPPTPRNSRAKPTSSSSSARPHRPGLQRSGSVRGIRRRRCRRRIRRPASTPTAPVRPATRP